jgi:hypothetical protein
MIPQAGMLVYDHKTQKLEKKPFGAPGMAYWHGSLNHMKIGNGKGFLISLMAETAPAGVERDDMPYINDEEGQPVRLLCARNCGNFRMIGDN